MPARHTTITCLAGDVTQLSDGAVAAIRIQRESDFPVYLQATATSTPPVSRLGALSLAAGTLAADLVLASLFPGVGPGPYYIWAFADATSDVSVSHA